MLQRCESAVHAERLRRVAEVGVRRAYLAAAHRSTADWLAEVCGLTGAEARQQAAVADALAQLPATADALAQGRITPGHAGAAARGLGELDRQAAIRRQDAGEDIDAWIAADDHNKALTGALDQLIADQAPNMDRIGLRKQIDAWTATHDPDALSTRNRRAMARRALRWSDTRDSDGLWTLTGKATDADKAQIGAALEPLSRKVSAEDDRTLSQRRLDALVTLARTACDAGQVPAGAAGRAAVLSSAPSTPTAPTPNRPTLTGSGRSMTPPRRCSNVTPTPRSSAATPTGGSGTSVTPTVIPAAPNASP